MIAGLAIVIGVSGGAILFVLSFLASDIAGLGDCGSGCQERISASNARADRLFNVGLIAGGLVTIAGIAALVALPKRPSPALPPQPKTNKLGLRP